MKVSHAIFYILLFSLPLFLQGCGKKDTSTLSEGKEIEMRYAVNLEMKEYDGFTVVNIRNPWDTASLLKSYLLLESGVERPAGFAESEVIRVPLDRSVVYSVVHQSLIHELGKENAVSGICDAQYVNQNWILDRLKSGVIEDCGDNLSPNVEKIIKCNPGAVLLSPYENISGHGKLDNAGIPIVECADYMESSPLGRAEWMKFYGILYGAKEKADSLFITTEKEYLRLKEMASASSSRPSVILDRIYGQAWDVPGGNSTMGHLIKDAGAKNPFDSFDVSGSVGLSPEKVLLDGGYADIWLIRYSGEPLTMKSLGDDKAIYSKFKAYRDSNVFGSDAQKSEIFDDIAFHPQWLLADMIRIFHPELSDSLDGKRFYYKLD